jgi:hypothetical protein
MPKILICLLFKNSNLWLDRFFDCIESLIFNEYNKKNNLEYEISIIYGSSNDGTEENIILRTQHLINNNIKVNILKFNPPDKFKTLERLAILRNIFLQTNSINKYDYLLMMDTDIIFEPRVIIKLIKDIENPKLESCAIIAPMIFIEDYGFHKNDFFYDILAYRIKGLNFKHNRPYIPIVLNGDNKYKRIIEVDSVGSLYLMKTSIMNKNDVHYGTYIKNVTEQKHESEQVYLCEKVRQNGLKIYVDLNLKVFHINLEKYGMKWH